MGTRGGRGFAFEHPRLATSWQLPSLRRLASLQGVFEIKLDMRQSGMTTADAIGNALTKKPTSLLTNVGTLGVTMDKTWSAAIDMRIWFRDGQQLRRCIHQSYVNIC